MRFLIFLAILMAFTLPVCAQSFTDSLAGNQTLIPSGTYYYPDGRQSDDSAWVKLGESVEWYDLTLFIKQDTTVLTGTYLRPTDFPCSVRVEIVASHSLDTLAYIGQERRKFSYADLDSMTVNADSVNDFYLSVASQNVYDNPWVIFHNAINGVAPMDTAIFVPLPDLSRFDKWRLKITVSDTMDLYFYVTGRR